MFASLSRSWEFAKISYGILWDYKKLIVFPLVSTVAAAIVTASFLVPLWTTGTLEMWMEFMDSESAAVATTADQIWMYSILFSFTSAAIS